MKVSIRFTITLLIVFLSKILVMSQEPVDSVKATQLGEVVVKGRQKQILTKGSITTIKVANTPLSQMGTVREMLSNTPGLYDDGTGIQVSGRGTPIYYLDGRELSDMGQLAILQASDIKEVRIQKAPGAEYPAGTKAVIFLITNKKIRDFVYLDVYDATSVKRKVSNTPGINMKAKIGDFSSTLSYAFSSSGSETRETYYRIINKPQYDFKSSQNRSLPTRTISHTINWSGEYTPSKNHHIGLYYYLSDRSRKEREVGSNHFIDKTSLSALDVLKRIDGNSVVHSVSTAYDYSKNEYSRLHLSQDFAYSSSDMKSSVEERAAGMVNMMDNDNGAVYRVSTTNLSTMWGLPWSMYAYTGAKMIYVNSRTRASTYSRREESYFNDYRLTVDEYTPQAYIALFRSFGNLSVYPGVRYEHIYRRIGRHDIMSAETIYYKYRKSSLYPYVTLQYAAGDVNAYVQYTRKVEQPPFSYMNTGISYVDTLTYSFSNPDLRPSISNEVYGSFNYKDFSLGLLYSHRKDPFENVEVLKDSNQSIVYSTYINMPYASRLSVSPSFGSQWGKLDYYGEVTFNFIKSKIYVDTYGSDSKGLSLDMNFNLAYKFNEKYSLYANYTFQGHHKELTMTQRSVQNLKAGFTGKFLRNCLSVNIEFMDILHKANYNNLWNTYKNVTNGTHGTNDMRGVRLRVAYTIFNANIKMRGGRENTEVLQRIK